MDDAQAVEEIYTTQKETIIGRRSSISSAAQLIFSRSRTLVESVQEELFIGVKVHVAVSTGSSIVADGSRVASSTTPRTNTKHNSAGLNRKPSSRSMPESRKQQQVAGRGLTYYYAKLLAQKVRRRSNTTVKRPGTTRRPLSADAGKLPLVEKMGLPSKKPSSPKSQPELLRVGPVVSPAEIPIPPSPVLPSRSFSSPPSTR